MGRKPIKPYNPEVHDDRVRQMSPTHAYTIPEIAHCTGWSRSNIYNMMASSLLRFEQRGAHRRVKGLNVKNVYFTQV